MNKSETIAELAAALAEAQGEMENASKNSQNPHLKNRYADLAEILNTIRPCLSKHGLSFSQHPSFIDGMVHVETVLLHKSGEWMSSTISTPVQKADPQGVGSATTYARRYSLAAIVGLSQEDDDGHAASNGKPNGAKQQPKPTTPAAPPTPQMMTDAQRKALMSLYSDCPREERLQDANEILKAAKPDMADITSFSQLTVKMAAYLIDELQKLQGRTVA